MIAKKITSQYVPPFLAFIKTLPLDFKENISEISYSNPILILADAVLSMNRKYNAFVVPRIKHLEKSGVTSLAQLDDLITKNGTGGFAEVWNYNDPKRAEILHNLTMTRSKQNQRASRTRTQH